MQFTWIWTVRRLFRRQRYNSATNPGRCHCIYCSGCDGQKTAHVALKHTRRFLARDSSMQLFHSEVTSTTTISSSYTQKLLYTVHPGKKPGINCALPCPMNSCVQIICRATKHREHEDRDFYETFSQMLTRDVR